MISPSKARLSIRPGWGPIRPQPSRMRLNAYAHVGQVPLRLAPPRPKPILVWLTFSSTNSQSPPRGLSIKWPRQVLMYPVPFGLGDKQQKHPWCPKPILFIPSFPAQTANRPRRALPSNGPGWFYFTILPCPSLLKLLADLVLIEESAPCRLQLPAIALLPP